MTRLLPYACAVMALTLASGIIIYACSNDEGRAALREFKDSFQDFIEGRDENALLPYVPPELTDFDISMDSGKTRMSPGSLDDLESIFEDVAYELSGDSVEVVQSNETQMGDGVVLTYTLKVVDGSLERTIPVKVSIKRDAEGGQDWVLSSLEVYN
jgi:hypothetical protein